VAEWRGLLVDWGGVLTSNVFDSFAAFCGAEGLDPGAVRDAFRGDPAARQLLVDLETGTLAESEFERRMCAALGLAGDRAIGLIERMFGSMRPDETMIATVAAARGAGVRTGLISNSWGARGYDQALLDELFDGVVISGQEGMRKPDPRMYALGAERIGLPPKACVYVDDLPGNLKPAREIGMATVHHVRASDTLGELEGLLGVSLNARSARAAQRSGPR